jgi:hypothetical protein
MSEEGKTMLGAIILQVLLACAIETNAGQVEGPQPKADVIIRMVSYEEKMRPDNNPPHLLRLYKSGQVKADGAWPLREFGFLFRDKKGKTVYLQVQLPQEEETTAATIASFLRELREAVPAGVRVEIFVRLNGLSPRQNSSKAPREKERK